MKLLWFILFAGAVSVLVVLSTHGSSEADGGLAESCVRDARSAFNSAIAERDTAGFNRFVVDDIHVTTGAGELLHGRADYQAIISLQAEDPRFVTFERLPSEIAVSQSHPLAAEVGRWTGYWDDPVATLGGMYMAQWRIEGEGCRLRSELFTTLECSGDRCTRNREP